MIGPLMYWVTVVVFGTV